MQRRGPPRHAGALFRRHREQRDRPAVDLPAFCRRHGIGPAMTILVTGGRLCRLHIVAALAEHTPGAGSGMYAVGMHVRCAT